MPCADAASRKYECPNGISRLLQVKDRFVEPHIDEVSNIFAKHETGVQLFNNSAHLRPEITGVCKALFCSDGGKGLTREASGYEGNAVLSCFFNKCLLCNCGNILKTRNIRPMLF